jgi:hypothetical protein
VGGGVCMWRRAAIQSTELDLFTRECRKFCVD